MGPDHFNWLAGTINEKQIKSLKQCIGKFAQNIYIELKVPRAGGLDTKQ